MSLAGQEAGHGRRIWRMIAVTAISVITGILIYAISQRTRQGKTDEQLLAEMAPAGGGGAGE